MVSNARWQKFNLKNDPFTLFDEWIFYFAKKLFSPKATWAKISDVILMYSIDINSNWFKLFNEEKFELFQQVIDIYPIPKLSYLFIVYLQYAWENISEMICVAEDIRREKIFKKWLLKNEINQEKWQFLIQYDFIYPTNDLCHLLSRQSLEFIQSLKPYIWFKQYSRLMKLHLNQYNSKDKKKIPFTKEIHV